MVSKRNSRITNKKIKVYNYTALLLVIMLAIVNLNMHIHFQLPSNFNNPEIKSSDARKLVDYVDRRITLPKNEMPIARTFIQADIDKYGVFTENSKPGDHLLIYLKTKKAVIYRFDTNRVINVGDVRTDGFGACGVYNCIAL